MRARRFLPLAATLLLAAVYFGIAASGPDARGFWQDDGIYLATARALADGEGYRHPEIPGRPLQTKYPILWPALLALTFRPGGDPRLALLPGALAAAAVVLGGIYLRRLGLPRPLALAATALAAASPSIVSMVRFTLSDLPFAALAAAALICLEPASGRDVDSRSALARRLAGAALTAAGVLVRPFGLTLALAAPVALALGRRWRDAALVAGVVLALVAPWWIWQGRAARAQGEIARALLVAPDLGHGSYAPPGAGEVARAAVQNGVRTAFGLARFELALPERLMTGGFAGSLPRTLVAHGFAWLALGLLLAGVAAAARRGARLLGVYFLLYAALMLVWPFEPFRFLVPWSPLLPGLVLLGLTTTARAAGFGERGAGRLGAAAVALLAVGFLVEDVRIAGSSEARLRVAGRDTALFAEDAAAMAELSGRAGPADVVASVLPARVWLLTGRPGVAAWHDGPPYAIYAGPERTFARFYLDGDVEELVRAQLRADLVRAYREAGVRWLLLARDSAPGPLLEIALARPDLFPRVWTSPGATQALFAFTPGP